MGEGPSEGPSRSVEGLPAGSAQAQRGLAPGSPQTPPPASRTGGWLPPSGFSCLCSQPSASSAHHHLDLFQTEYPETLLGPYIYSCFLSVKLEGENDFSIKKHLKYRIKKTRSGARDHPHILYNYWEEMSVLSG